MTATVSDTSEYAQDRALNWATFSASTAPLPDYWDRWVEYSHDWKIPIRFLQPVGVDAPNFIDPLRPLLDTLGQLEEVQVVPTAFMHMPTVDVGLLMATGIMWSQVESIYASAAPRLHRIEPFVLRVGGVSAFEHSLYLGVDDGLVVREVRRQIRLGVPVVHERMRADPAAGEFIPHIKIAYFTGKGSRQNVADAVAPYLDAEAGEVRVDEIKMARVPVDPDHRFPDLDVIAEIRLYGDDYRKGYHS